MTYKSPEYYALSRNVTKTQTMLRQIDDARTFNSLQYVEQLTMKGRSRADDRDIEITISGGLMKAILNLCAQHCIEAAEAIHRGEWEANDFDKAAKV